MASQVVNNPEFKEEIFGVPSRPHLLHQAVVAHQANKRAGSAATKSKGFVRGGGKKPWRQKGTGRARAGSIRSPIWVGGGTIFGPTPRDYSYRMPKKARREALLSALSLKRKEGKIIVLAGFDLAETKTKLVRQMLDELQVKSALIVLPENDDKVMLSVRNLPKVKALRVEGLNVYDLLRYEHLIMTEPALKLIEERLAA
ncbi:MAG TPA: 50S ribosomal protein L4 [Verrucomicrobiae bacterium]|jgi:large subunit ribosomal protein L4|nr:50S ribosomal protein L4 [Verrucomicrobiae bacterium]